MDAEPRVQQPGASLLSAAAVAVGRRLRSGALPGSIDEADDQLLDELLLPLRVEPDWPGPMAPQRAGNGWVQADLTDTDLDAFDRLRSLHPHDDAEALACHAQEWRLPVLPYRAAHDRWKPERRPRSSPEPTPPVEPSVAPAESGVASLRILDLSSLWAGPFATSLLARLGATVVKVDADCRPDGFRDRAHLYARLNNLKEIVDLDLRQPADRQRFERLVCWADVMVTSFSRRVLPNLGYGRPALLALNPALSTVAIVGFPSGSLEAEWLAYGSGIHAVCGLGIDERRGTARAAPVAYPDPLTGYLAVQATRALTRAGGLVEVSLAEAGALVADEAFRISEDGR